VLEDATVRKPGPMSTLRDAALAVSEQTEATRRVRFLTVARAPPLKFSRCWLRTAPKPATLARQYPLPPLLGLGRQPEISEIRRNHRLRAAPVLAIRRQLA
jgi:hypothetical protein